MILRRIASAFRRQDWFTVFVETMIVVLGVFLGLQVNNWNADQAAKRQGAAFSERLRADLRFEAQDYETLIAYMRDVQMNVDMALAVLDGSAEASNEALLISAYRATQYTDGSQRRATFDELTSTGTMGLIEDAGLRDLATLVYTSKIREGLTNEGINSRYRAAFRMILPIEVQDAIAAHCGDRFGDAGEFGAIRNQLNYECATGLSPAVIDAAAKTLRDAPDVVPLLRLRAIDVRTQLANLTFQNQDVLDGLHAIATEAP